MTTSHAVVLALGGMLMRAAPAGAQSRDVTLYLMDRAAEVSLARSAAPRTIADAVTVLVLTRTGYVEAVSGTNGFTCLVLRSFSGPATDAGFAKDPGFWNPHVQSPYCANPPAARTVLPPMLASVQWLLSGTSPVAADERFRQAYASHQFPSPAPGAMAYMLSSHQYLTENDPHWMPHLMFYFDRSLPATTWAAGGPSATVIDADAGDPTSPILTLLVPVRQWSDGTSAATRSR
jgi:hypothetical protein